MRRKTRKMKRRRGGTPPEQTIGIITLILTFTASGHDKIDFDDNSRTTTTNMTSVLQ